MECVVSISCRMYKSILCNVPHVWSLKKKKKKAEWNGTLPQLPVIFCLPQVGSPLMEARDDVWRHNLHQDMEVPMVTSHCCSGNREGGQKRQADGNRA